MESDQEPMLRHRNFNAHIFSENVSSDDTEDLDCCDTADEETRRPGSPSAAVKSFFCFDQSSKDFMAISGHALDKMEDIARQAEEFVRSAWEECSAAEVRTKAREKAEELAHYAGDLARYAWVESTTELLAMRIRAQMRAGELARHASAMPGRALDKAEEFAHQAKHVWDAGTLMCHHHLPKWMKDNDFLLSGHRPQMNSCLECFKSVFRLHTETGNIWTHMIGCVAFIVAAIVFLSKPSIGWQEKAVFSTFFMGAILCLGFSSLFHIMHCHSEKVGRFFSKLDYCGIALLIVGSFVPWLYYSFYCRLSPKIAYLTLVITLGIACIVISMWDKFGEPQFRPFRAGVFVALGLTGIIPCAHYVITDGFYHAVNYAALGWVALIGLLYIIGAAIYTFRFPERFWPGSFDIWFQSHQIFHVFVVAAAFLHFYAMYQVAHNRVMHADCTHS